MAREKGSRRKDRLSQHNADLDIHESDTPSLRRAAESWQTAEPWLVRERRNRRRRIAVISVLAVAVIVVLTVTGPKPARLTHSAVVGVAESSPGAIRFLFWGCNGEQLLRVEVFKGPADIAEKSTGDGALWYVNANTSQGASGGFNAPLGEAPPRMSTRIPLNGLAAVPNDALIWVYALTNRQLLQFDFDKSLLAGGKVFTAAGSFTPAQYNTEGAQLCGSSK
jgi:hypothetical protein